MESSIRDIQNAIKFLAAALPPIPAFALFLLVSVRRLRREKIGVAATAWWNSQDPMGRHCNPLSEVNRP